MLRASASMPARACPARARMPELALASCPSHAAQPLSAPRADRCAMQKLNALGASRRRKASSVSSTLESVAADGLLFARRRVLSAKVNCRSTRNFCPLNNTHARNEGCAQCPGGMATWIERRPQGPVSTRLVTMCVIYETPNSRTYARLQYTIMIEPQHPTSERTPAHVYQE